MKNRELGVTDSGVAGPLRSGLCHLPLHLAHPTGTRRLPVSAIVDTGCTTSAIRPGIAQALGLPVVGTTQVAVAGRPSLRCELVKAQIVLPSGVTWVRRLTVAAMDHDMLWGTDLLAGGVLTVDLVAGRWEWRTRE